MRTSKMSAMRILASIFCSLAILSHTYANYAPNLQAEESSRSRSPSPSASDQASGLQLLKFTRMAWGLDKAYVTTAYLGAPHFRQNGWGFNPLDQTDPVYLCIKSSILSLQRRAEPKEIDISWDGDERLEDGVKLRDGRFKSPGSHALPQEAHTAIFRAVWPISNPHTCPMLVLLPPNGDEAYDRRFKGIARNLALEHGIGSVLLVPPFYSDRRASQPGDVPPLRRGQHASVANLLLTGIISAEETRSLMHWLRRRGHMLVGVSGASFGSFTACVAAASSRLPVAVAACLPCHSAEVCWTDSVMAAMCDFRRLAADLNAAAPLHDAAASVPRANSSYADGFLSAESSEDLSEASGPAGGADGVVTGLELADAAVAGGRRRKWTSAGARGVLRRLLSELTDLTRFPRPVLTAAAVLVSARNDAYIASDSAAALHRHWAGSELRAHDGGHVTSFLFNRGAFRRACVDAVARLRRYGPCAPFSARLFVDSATAVQWTAAAVAAVAATTKGRATILPAGGRADAGEREEGAAAGGLAY